VDIPVTVRANRVVPPTPTISFVGSRSIFVGLGVVNRISDRKASLVPVKLLPLMKFVPLIVLVTMATKLVVKLVLVMMTLVLSTTLVIKVTLVSMTMFVKVNENRPVLAVGKFVEAV